MQPIFAHKRSIFWLIALLILVISVAPLANASAQSNAPQWSLQIQYSGAAASALTSSARQALGNQAKQMNLQAASSDAQVTITGAGGQGGLRSLLHNVNSAAPLNPILLPSELTVSGSVQAGEKSTLALDANLTNGYSWKVADARGVEVVGTPEVVAVNDRMGAPLRQTFHWQANQSGKASLHLIYRRPFGPAEATQMNFTLSADTLAQFTDLTDPTPAPAEFSLPPQVDHPGRLQAAPPVSLPSSYSWLAQGKLTPVRDQGQCGSCWAFGTVGPLEANILIKDGISADLSEQFLISCNNNGFSCAKGGSAAHDYHQNRLGVSQSSAGAVLEQDFPYQAADSACPANLPHSYKITDWNYINYNTPDVNAIKQAIITYGPVMASICAGPAFQAYRSGVFSTDESGTSCGGSVNHAIVLAGWDDADGTWILRNSWNSWWGENGYMRIKYNTSGVGKWANYVVYPASLTPAPAVPTLASPQQFALFNTAQSILFQWNTAANATEYQLHVWGTGYDNTSAWTAATSLDIGTLPLNSYSWQVKAHNANGESGWSQTRMLNVQAALVAPTLIAPNDQSQFLTTTSLVLSWNAVPNVYSYSVHLTSDAGLDVNSGALSWTSWDQTYQLSAGTYHWQVRATNSFGDGPWSETRAFTLVDTLNPPAIISPSFGSKVFNLPSFEVDCENLGTLASEYMISITNTDTQEVTTSNWSASRGFTLLGFPAGNYTVQAQARNGIIISNWGAVTTFRVANAANIAVLPFISSNSHLVGTFGAAQVVLYPGK